MYVLILIVRVINYDYILVLFFFVIIVILLILIYSGLLLMNIYYLNCIFFCGGCYGICSIIGNVYILIILWVFGFYFID